jgi:hypothetical protein
MALPRCRAGNPAGIHSDEDSKVVAGPGGWPGVQLGLRFNTIMPLSRTYLRLIRRPLWLPRTVTTLRADLAQLRQSDDDKSD